MEIALLAIPLAARIRRDGYRVCLTGEGADEVFGGYGTLAEGLVRRRVADGADGVPREDGPLRLMRVKERLMRPDEPRLPFLERPLVEAVLGLAAQGVSAGKAPKEDARGTGSSPAGIIPAGKETSPGGGRIPDYCDEVGTGEETARTPSPARSSEWSGRRD